AGYGGVAGLRLYSLPDMTLVHTYTTEQLGSAALTPDGAFVAGGNAAFESPSVTSFTAAGDHVRSVTFAPPNPYAEYRGVAISTDGKRLWALARPGGSHGGPPVLHILEGPALAQAVLTLRPSSHKVVAGRVLTLTAHMDA